MGKQSTERTRASRPTWDTLEDWLRGQVQGLIQRVLEDEVTEFVGRTKSQPGATVGVAEADAVEPALTRRDGAQPAADTLAAHSKTYNSLAHKERLGIVFFGIIPSSPSVRLKWTHAVDQKTSPTDTE
ncbi:MAG: hypothetical protein V3S25_10770 [Nitrospirales bacterium]